MGLIPHSLLVCSPFLIGDISFVFFLSISGVKPILEAIFLYNSTTECHDK